MYGTLPTAIIDKSVFQRIAELSSSERRNIWGDLRGKFQVIIPFVLVEEVLSNRGHPGDIPRNVVETMFRELMKVSSYWLDDELGWIFDELVEGTASRQFKPVPKEFLRRLAALDPKGTDYQEFLIERKKLAAENLELRMTTQNEAARWRAEQKFHGERWVEDEHKRLFCLVSTEKEFFDRFVAPGFHARDENPGLWFDFLDRSLGERMRDRCPDRSREIEHRLREVTSKRLFDCPMAFSCVVAKSAYFWSPLVRIGNDFRNSVEIIGRKKKAQRNNIHDERYVAAAMLCDTILTRDEDMAQMSDCLARVGLWRGKPTYFPAGEENDIRVQVASLPRP